MEIQAVFLAGVGFIGLPVVLLNFFFSSRRRHTRYIGDWSSDVCSSDLPAVVLATGLAKYYQHGVMTRKGQHPAIKAERLADRKSVV